MKKTSFLSLVLLGLIGSLSVASAMAQQVVANSGVAISDISKGSLGDILNGRATTLPDGSAVTIVIARQSAATDKMLPDLSGGQGIDQFQSSWKRLVYVGKGKMPLFVADNKELLDKVASTPGAIGLAESGAAPGVKVIAVK